MAREQRVRPPTAMSRKAIAAIALSGETVNVAAGSHDPADDYRREAGRFTEWLNTLSARPRRLIELLFLENLSLTEIAQNTGLSMAAVRTGVMRSLEQLQRRLSHPDPAQPSRPQRAAKVKSGVVPPMRATTASAETPEAIWREHLGPLLDAEAARTQLGLGSREELSNLARSGQLLALETKGHAKLYPAFQFTSRGKPYKDLASLLDLFAGAAESPYTVASWMVSPNPVLEGQSPIAWMRSGRALAPLHEAARRSAGRLAR